jgi:hypothetical protein
VSAKLLWVTVAIYGLVAYDRWRLGAFTEQWWIGSGFFFYACANVCFAMATAK